MIDLKEFDYNLPEELIAQEPVERREDSRLMVVFCKEKKWNHCYFKNLIDYLKSGDILVVNDTKVIPARLKGKKIGDNREVEILLVQEKEPGLWNVLVKPARKVKIEDIVQFGSRLKGIIKDVTSIGCLIEFISDGDFKEILQEIGEVPLPHYIKRPGSPTEKDKIRYQTVYARSEGAIAAPTAGLHFSYELIKKLNKNGIDIFSVTLHIGIGSFRPIRSPDILMHKMEKECFEIENSVFNKIILAKKVGRRIIAVGTSTVRALEGAISTPGFNGGKSFTDLYIYPGYKFKVIDGLITNFHLPRSTPLVLTCAFAGRELILKSYQEAIDEHYSFLSFGDAMLILAD